MPGKEHSIFLQSTFHFLFSLQLSFDTYPQLNNIINLLHCVLLMGFILVITFCTSSADDDTFSQSLLSLLLPNSPSNSKPIFMFASWIMSIMFVVLAALHAYKFRSMRNIYEQSLVMKTILGLVMCILLIHELFLFFWINIIVSEYLNLGQGQVNGADILTVIGTTVLVTFQFVFRAKERVFGVSSIMIFVALNILQNQISLAIIGVGSCLYAHKTYNSFDQSIYISIAITCGWSIIEQISQTTATNFSANELMSLSYLTLSLLFANIFVLFRESDYNAISQIDENFRLMKFLQNHSASDNMQNQKIDRINIEQEFYYEKYLNKLSGSGIPLPIDKQLRGVPVIDWDKQLVHKTLWHKVKSNRERNSSFEMNMFYFRHAVNLDDKAIDAFKEMIDFIDLNTNNGNLLRQYQLTKLSFLMRSRYCRASASDNVLKLSMIVLTEQIYHKIYIDASSILIQIVDFWRQVILSGFHINKQIEGQIFKIVKLKLAIENSIKSICQFRVDRQIALLDSIKMVVNPFDRNSEEKILRARSRNKTSIQVSFKYFISSNGAIKTMTFKMLRLLKYPTETLLNQSLKDILPPDFMGFIQQIERDYIESVNNSDTKNTVQRSWKIPLVNKTGDLLISECKLYLLPSFHDFCFLYYFQHDDATNQLLFLYNFKLQRIVRMNANFKKFIIWQSEDCDLEQPVLINQIFDAELKDTSMELMRMGDSIKSKVIYRKFLKKRDENGNLDDVTLSMDHQYCFASKHYLIVKVTSETFKMQQMEDQFKVKSLSIKNNKEKPKHELYINEKFMCPIENPYKSTIIEKLQSATQQTNHRNLFFWLALLLFLALGLLLGNCIMVNYYTSAQINGSQSIVTTMKNLNNEYITLLKLYFTCYLRKYVINNRPQVKDYINRTVFNSSGPVGQVNDYYDSILLSYLNQSDILIGIFLSTYLNQKNLNGHHNMNYTVQFDDFTLLMDTTMNSFYDFIVRISKDFPSDNQMQFLATNYDSLISIMPVYQQYMSFFQDFAAGFEIINTFIAIVAGAIFVLIMICYFLIYKMTQITKQIKELYTFVNKKDIAIVIDRINQIKKLIGNISYDQSVSSDKKPHDGTLGKEELFLTSVKDLSGVLVQDLPDEEEEKEVNTAVEKKKQPSNLEETFRNLPMCFVVLLFTAGLSYYEYVTVTNSKNSFSDSLLLFQKFQSEQMSIDKEYLNVFQPQFYLDANGLVYNQILAPIITKTDFVTKTLPATFSKYFHTNQSLCSEVYQSYITDPLISMLKCAQVYNSILTSDYSESLQYYQSRLSQIRVGPLANYSDAFNESSHYNLVFIVYTKYLLSGYLETQKDLFLSNLIYYNAEESQNYNFIMVSIILVILANAAVTFWSLKQLRNKFMTSFWLMCIIPSTAMYRLKLTNYLRKFNLLNKIKRL